MPTKYYVDVYRLNDIAKVPTPMLSFEPKTLEDCLNWESDLKSVYSQTNYRIATAEVEHEN